MVKAVFFDWFNTLAVYRPPGEIVQSQALQENGYTISSEILRPALFEADKFYHSENAVNPVRLRSQEEQTELCTAYENLLLLNAGIDLSDSPDTLLKIYKRSVRLRTIGFALFDDVLPVLLELKNRAYTMGVITNIDQDMEPVIKAMTPPDTITVIVTSGEAGSAKPQAGIFNLALKKAFVSAEEAIHVGDQYSGDIIGAKGVGIKPVLIDRNNAFPYINDCLKIQKLGELIAYLE